MTQMEGQHSQAAVKREDIVLDPDGDITLILEKHQYLSGSGHGSNSISAVATGSGSGGGSTPTSSQQGGGGGAGSSGAGVGAGSGSPSGKSPGGSQRQTTGTATSHPRLPSRSPTHSVSSSSTTTTKQIHCLVSSKHLMLASSVFRAMLHPRSSTTSTSLNTPLSSHPRLAEAEALATTGHATIPLPEDPPEAMIIVLHIIHHRYSEVARQISRHLLAQVAVLVDKYDLRRSVEFVSTTWFDNFSLGKKRGGTLLPTKFSDELLEWLFLSWVFGYADIFFSMTRIAMAQSWCRLDNDSLAQFPFPSTLIEMIDHRRQRGIQKILDVYESFINRSWGNGSPNSIACPGDVAECDAKVLGTLLRAGRQLSIYPIPKAPYPGISFTDLHRDLDGVEVPTCGEHHYYYSNRQDFNDVLNAGIKGEFAEGLLLKSFMGRGGTMDGAGGR